MEYTINKLATLSKVSRRTLHYYHEIGLLTPARIDSNGYRIYGKKEVEQLQQILFFREMDMPLSEIKKIMTQEGFSEVSALKGHLSALSEKRSRLNLLIANVEKSLKTAKGETIMTDAEKFEGFKQKQIEENEKKYGKEIRAKYGDCVIDNANAKYMGTTQAQQEETEKLTKELNTAIKNAYAKKDPTTALAKRMYELHKKWLMSYLPKGTYTKETHKAIVLGYTQDARFSEYYDKIAVGSAQFIKDAVWFFCDTTKSD